VAIDGHRAVADWALGTGIRAGNADGALALLGEADVLAAQDGIAFAGQREQALDPLAVAVVLIPGGVGEQLLEAWLGGSGDDQGDGSQFLLGCSVSKPVR
jgi:hypothetical protein